MGAMTLRAPVRDLHREPNADALFRLDHRLSTAASGGAEDSVTAHILFDLAARLGSLKAKVFIRELSDEVDLDDVAAANQAVRDRLARA